MIYRPDYMHALKAFKDKPLVKILTGVRRCGKSTIRSEELHHTSALQLYSPVYPYPYTVSL